MDVLIFGLPTLPTLGVLAVLSTLMIGSHRTRQPHPDRGRLEELERWYALTYEKDEPGPALTLEDSEAELSLVSERMRALEERYRRNVPFPSEAIEEWNALWSRYDTLHKNTPMRTTGSTVRRANGSRIPATLAATPASPRQSSSTTTATALGRRWPESEQAMRECMTKGCPHPAPGYDEFCAQHSPPDWRCECGDLNRHHEAFCYRCGAGQPDDHVAGKGRP